MDSVFVVLFAIMALILANGWLALAELALVGARKTRLERLAGQGNSRADRALKLVNAPGRFLSTIQLGITLVGVASGALGGAALADPLGSLLVGLGLAESWSRSVALIVVIVTITVSSMVLGELIPKRIALSRPERLAMAVAPTLDALARAASPLVNTLTAATEGTVRLFGIHGGPEPAITEDEINMMIERGTRMGLFEPAEQEIVSRVFRLADRTVTTVMTPYPDLTWIDLDGSEDAVRARLAGSGHTRLPVIRTTRENVVGILHTRDLVAQQMRNEPLNVHAAVRPALLVPEGTRAFSLLERFREERSDVALVIDEYGGLQGLVTATDLLEALVGDLPLPESIAEPEVVRRPDGTLLIDGALPIDELKSLLGVSKLAAEDSQLYETLGGFIMTYLGHVPATGETFKWEEFTFEIMDMDRHRIDKVLVKPPPPITPDGTEPDAPTGDAPPER